jgi:hypothetical protein
MSDTPRTDALFTDWDQSPEVKALANLARHLELNLNEAKTELAAIKRRLSGELSEDCPLCSKIPMDGSNQQCPMCPICQLESDRDIYIESSKRLKSELKFFEDITNTTIPKETP